MDYLIDDLIWWVFVCLNLFAYQTFVCWASFNYCFNALSLQKQVCRIDERLEQLPRRIWHDVVSYLWLSYEILTNCQFSCCLVCGSTLRGSTSAGQPVVKRCAFAFDWCVTAHDYVKVCLIMSKKHWCRYNFKC